MRERAFAPTLLVGLAGATLAAVGAGQDWATATGDSAGVEVSAAVTGADSVPLSLALPLVALAAWGAVLVLRGTARRLAALLGAVAAAGTLAVVVLGFDGVQDDARVAVVAAGATGDTFVTGLTGWYWASAVGALLTLAALTLAVARGGRWPTMGSRYDAPSARGREPYDDDDDLWRALDEGHDPTA